MENKSVINLEGLFKGADLSGAQIIAVNEGEVYYNKYGGNVAAKTKTEEEVKQAIARLMETKNDDGGFLMHDSDQWYAVFRVLSSFCGFPTKAPDFARSMKNLGMDEMRKAFAVPAWQQRGSDKRTALFISEKNEGWFFLLQVV